MALGLIALGVRETLEAGRRRQPQREAVQRTAMHFKVQGVAHVLPAVIADTLEHMFRTDLMLVLMMLAHLLRVPHVSLARLLGWLETGEGCPEAQAFYELHQNAPLELTPEQQRAQNRGFLVMGATATDERLLPTQHCMYLTHEKLRVTIPANRGGDARSAAAVTVACEAIAARLRGLFEVCLLG